MFIMYVDESGDSGAINLHSPSRYFILSGVVVHETLWPAYLDRLVAFRKRMLHTFGLHLREEIHAAHFITKPKEFSRIKKGDRLTILRMFTDELAAMPELNVINVVIDKQGKKTDYQTFDIAWKALIQRFENTMVYGNLHGHSGPDDKGMIICDHSNNQEITRIMRQMRRYNPIPNAWTYGAGYRNLVFQRMIEDPNFRDSKDSYYIQAADLCSYLVLQYIHPNQYIKSKTANNYLTRLDPVLCKVTSRTDPLGIVRI